MSPPTPKTKTSSKKRKLHSSSTSLPSKKLKTSPSAPASTSLRSANDLPWKTVSRKLAVVMDMEEGFLGLEEVEDVDVMYEEGEAGVGGKVVRFRVKTTGNGKRKDTIDVECIVDGVEDIEGEISLDGIEGLEDEDDGWEGEYDLPPDEDELLATGPEIGEETTESRKDKEGDAGDDYPVVEEVESFDVASLLPSWHALFATKATSSSSSNPTPPTSLHPTLLHALYAQHFTSPTPIQSQTLPKAIQGRDIIGVSETGSGKTLAYGLPILHYLLDTAPNSLRPESREGKRKRRSVRALVLAPTRELALQVSSHLNACLNHYDTVDGIKTEDAETTIPAGKKGKRQKGNDGKQKEAKAKGPPPVSVAAIVGGMSAQKQKRVLERGVDVLVATPGRLWDIIEEDDSLAEDIKHLRFLVLDEADRMIEAGHFQELDNVLKLTRREFQKDTTDAEFLASSSKSTDKPEVAEQGTDQAQTASDVSVNDTMQTFVFSATLSKDLQRNLKKRQLWKKSLSALTKKGDKGPDSTLDELLMRLDFRDEEPQVVDLSPEGGVVETLKESKIECLMTDKDIYLYYFLLRYPGRTLVFLASVDGIRRMLPLFELLGLPVYPLHSQMEQRQRLKNLDRFKSNPHAILLATDIASRGLDVPSVDHVVHYQIPRTADTYVHRNGRTARAKRKGFSMLMIAPDERRVVRALMGSLGREESSIPEMTVEHHLLDKLKPRLQLAKQVENAQHKVKKEKHEKNWLKATAEAMDIDLDEDFVKDSDDETANPSARQAKKQNAKVESMKAELKRLLAMPLVAKGVSTRYITSGSRPIVDDIIQGDYHEAMVGVKKAEAGDDLVSAKKSKSKGNKKGDKKKKEGKVKKDDEGDEDEWTGFGS